MAIHGTLAIVVSFTLCGLSTVVIALRFYARHFLVGKLSSPDWFIFFALLVTWTCAVVNLYQIHYMDYPKAFSLDYFIRNVEGGLLAFWIYRIIYLLSLCLIKLSILLFYNYFASTNKAFHRWVRGLMVIVVLASFSMIVASIMMCNPPSDAWSARVFVNGGMGVKDFHCYNPTVMWFFSAGFNLLTDFIIWILPMPFLLNLRSMPLKRRLELVAIFSIGIVAIIASAIRLYIMSLWARDFFEQAKQTGNFLIWGQVEQHAGIISASIPFLRPLVRKIFSPRGERRNQFSPCGRKKLLGKPATPEVPTPEAGTIEEIRRAPIIPSPSPTLNPRSRYHPPPSPMSPLQPHTSLSSVF
ncbi:hypothetical protein GQ43DRAFT_151604 [Delitschia confertaspora ATCC 74209]|uniref:Rhodopsin domain-containing protein n=1 Tax=Delitschia confertaspora ATCC 74209 TaxID=1513339 RepID=A0A9P4MPS7_9PLEO|nr:hypothetical protein GQ43DRAFT_151604 [Delitschia confertaspora ATCC 74209]